MKRISFLTFLSLLQFSTQKSTPQDASYVAAVVEYQVRADVDENILNYMQLIEQAAQQNADIVVLPEMTLTRGGRAVTVPMYSSLKEFRIPALQPALYDQILVNISEAARKNDIYVVINVQERMDCTLSDNGEVCPEEKDYLFNTNVVFDRAGGVIDRYRKINLFGEFSRTPALTPDLGVFDTDFGVTFGHFICFDLMFQVPAIQVVEKTNITDVIFPTMWFSEMPYLTAVQIQEAYAYAMNVNFLGSGANNVGVGSAGSGIYSGKAGALISIMPGVPTTHLLVSRVPKVPGQVNFPVPGPIYDNPSDHDGLRLISDPSLPAHVSRQLVPGFQEFTLVDKEVSCKFTARLNQRDATYVYRGFVQDGSTTYSRTKSGVAACGLVACKNHDPKSCVYRFGKNDNKIEIAELELTMNTHRYQYNDTLKCDNVVYFPSSMQIDKFPLSRRNVTYIDSRKDGAPIENGGRERITYKINTPQNNLVSFGIWGRIYTRDVNMNKKVTDQDVQDYMALENIIYFVQNVKED